MTDESPTKLANTSKEEDVVTDEESTIAKVAERLRFFFSDANLRTDKFLRRDIFRESSGGFVCIDTLLRFNTIKQFTSDPDVVASATKHVFCSTKLKLNDDGTSIARCVPFTKDMMTDNVKVTLRISNLPVEGPDVNSIYKVTRNDIRSLFEEYGHVALVRMLYHYKDISEDNKCFPGSRKGFARIAIGRAFVEFESVHELQNAADDLCIPNGSHMEKDEEKPNPKRVLKFGNNELSVKTMQQWLDKKLGKKGQRAVGSEVGCNGGVREKRHHEGKNKEENDETTRLKVRENVVTDTFTIEWRSGCIIALKGLPDDCDREKIIVAVTAVFGDDVKVWADYSRGLKNGNIRFDKPNDNIFKLATQLADGNIKIDGSTVDSAYVLAGKEEEEYYEDFIAFKNKQIRLRTEERQRKKVRFNRKSKSF